MFKLVCSQQDRAWDLTKEWSLERQENPAQISLFNPMILKQGQKSQ